MTSGSTTRHAVTSWRRQAIAPIPFVSLALLALGACGSAHGPHETYQALESWTATLDVTAHAWLDGTVPERYARETIDSARAQLRDIVAEQSKRLAPDVRRGVELHAARVDDRARRLADAVARSDRAAAAGPASEIHDEARAIAVLEGDRAGR